MFELSTLETQILLKSMELNICGGENVKNIYKLETDFFSTETISVITINENQFIFAN